MSLSDNIRSGSLERPVIGDKPGTKVLSQPTIPGSHNINVTQADIQSHCVSSTGSLTFEFFDKEEQERREAYRNRVERHYCRLIEEERLSPESASVLSDAFAEAEERAKYRTIKDRSEVKPEYHTGIDKSVWQEIDHQRSKSFERLKHKDNISSDNYNWDNKDTTKWSLNMEQDSDTMDYSNRFVTSKDLSKSVQSENASDRFDRDVHEGNFDQNGYNEQSLKSTILDSNLQHNDGDINLNSGHYNDINMNSGSDSETLNVESDEENSESDESEDEFDMSTPGQREWRSQRGNLAVEKGMDSWLDTTGNSERDIDEDGRKYFKEKIKQYKETVAAKERGIITKAVKHKSSLPSASPTPMDYDADVEYSTKETPPRSSSQSYDQWSDTHSVDDKYESNVTEVESSKVTYNFMPKPLSMSCRSSVSSEKNRVDHSTYQSYTAGLLHSSGKSEKFLKLQKHFAVLERITEIENKTHLHGSPGHSPSGFDISTEMFAKYDVQCVEELQWLYQELNDAHKNEEFFYDLQKLAVYQWKPTKDYGLKRKGKSLNDLRKIYEVPDEEDYRGCYPVHASFFDRPSVKHGSQKSVLLPGQSNIRDKSKCPKSSVKVSPRPLYGTHIPEVLDGYEILVENTKRLNKEKDNFTVDNLHIRSLSAPYSKHLQDSSNGPEHKRSDSFKGAMFGKSTSPERSEKKQKPTVAEVTPVPRQVSKKSSQFYPKIMSGPHDFAGHMTTTEAVARPMQSNMHIYNSLENPQYKATMNLDEPVRKLSRGRSNDNFVIHKDADGNYSVSAPERTANRPLEERSTGRNSANNHLNSDRSRDGSPTVSATVYQENASINPTPAFIIDDSTHNILTESSPSPITSMSGSKLASRPPVPPSRNRFTDRSPLSSVRQTVASFENRSEDTANSQMTMNDPSSADVTDLPKSQTVPDLLENQPMFCSELPHLHERQRSNSDQNLARSNERRPEYPPPVPRRSQFSSLPRNSNCNKSAPIFTVRNLRPLAQNNEFCKSQFFPKSVSTQSLHPDTTHQEIEPLLHAPVVGQIFKKPGTVNKNDVVLHHDRIQRRNSTSSTDTFIVKDSDDEGDVQYKMAYSMNLRDTADQKNKSKSVPDLTEEELPRRPRSAKSYMNLDAELESGRHCLPRTVSGDLNDITSKYSDNSKFRKKIHSGNARSSNESFEDCVRNAAENLYGSKESQKYLDDNSEVYMPPEDIVNDMMKSHNLYKRSVPKEKPKTPSVIGKMTMDYLQEIGNEWAVSKNNTSFSGQYGSNENMTIPVTEPFVTSDRSATPNKWVPVFHSHSESPVTSAGQNIDEHYSHDRPSELRSDHDNDITTVQSATYLNKGPVSDYQKYLTLPRKPKPNSTDKGFAYSTIPRMRPDTETMTTKEQEHTVPPRRTSSLGKILSIQVSGLVVTTVL